MKFFIAFVVLLKVAQSRFLRPEFPDNVPLQKFLLHNYDQPHPIFPPRFHIQHPLGYRPILAYDQSRYPLYNYADLENPFGRKYRPYWIFRTRFCRPLDKTTDRNEDATTESNIATEKVENTESVTIIEEEKTVNSFTTEAPTTTNEEIEVSQNDINVTNKNTTKEQEEATNIDNAIPTDFEEPEAV